MACDQRRVALEVATTIEALIDLADDADLQWVALLLRGAWRRAIQVAADRETPKPAPSSAAARTSASAEPKEIC